jgi:hypothetical protein
MNKFIVKVNYTKFVFNDANEAIEFALKAKNNAREEDIDVEITILKEEVEVKENTEDERF